MGTIENARNTGHVRHDLGTIFGHDGHDFCGAAFMGTIGTFDHFVTPEVQILDRFSKFFRFLLITL